VKFLENPPRHFFFTGKGGVGKTSVACATALTLARRGKRVLLVSTDPASNVGQVFGTRIGDTVTPIESVPGLDAIEINPDEAAEAYREKILAPVRAILPIREIETITEQLSGSCTTEIASFNEFTDLLADPSSTAAYDHVIFDTAPTGHTIRLLQLPGSWTSYLDDGLGDASCLGPMAGLEKSRATYRAAVGRLTDSAATRIVLVSRAQHSTLGEVARTAAELNALGIRASHLVVNGVLRARDSSDPLAAAIRGRESAALRGLPSELAGLVRDEIALRVDDMVGVAALETLLVDEDPSTPGPDHVLPDLHLPAFADLVDELASQDHGLVMAMGKGGVGKTTVAAALAVALVRRGKKVLLTTTDPAAHVSQVLAGDLSGLEVASIDPQEATRVYRETVMRTKGASLDEVGRAALAEDLMSPCTEEIAVFQQFSRAVNRARDQFVVMDTAPTGHTLLLMDATGSYHRDITRHLDEAHRSRVTTPLMRLQDPDYTKVIIVALPETTPVLEAQGLVADLGRAGITPWAWVVNASLAAARPSSPFLVARAEREVPLLARVRAVAPRMAVVPMRVEEPVGVEQLSDLTQEASFAAT
jgi:arsenite/tail-anchored protein-transporting ATPase